MDPDALLSRILDFIGSKNTQESHDEFYANVQSLFQWVAKGGFPPKIPDNIQNLGTNSSWCPSTRQYRIQTVDVNSDKFGWEIVEYTGKRTKQSIFLGR